MSGYKENVRIKSRCNVRNCERNPSESVHRLPNQKYIERREKWTRALQLPSNIRGRFYVCSYHFRQEDFRDGFSRKCLHDWAVPSLHLPQKRKVLKCLDSVNEVSPVQADASISDDRAESTVNELSPTHADASISDDRAESTVNKLSPMHTDASISDDCAESTVNELSPMHADASISDDSAESTVNELSPMHADASISDYSAESTVNELSPMHADASISDDCAESTVNELSPMHADASISDDSAESTVNELSPMHADASISDDRAESTVNELSPMHADASISDDSAESTVNELSPMHADASISDDRAESTVNELSPMHADASISDDCAESTVNELSPMHADASISNDSAESTVNELSPMHADASISDDRAKSTVNELSPMHVDASISDDRTESTVNELSPMMPNHLIADEELEDELFVQIDSDSDDEFLADKGAEIVESKHLSARKHEYATQPDSKLYADECVQTNLAYDELRKPWAFLDSLHTESDLSSWTGLQRFVTLNNIVDCMMRLKSAQDQQSKLKASPKQLVLFIMMKLKTNLTYKQLSSLFSLAPSTLTTCFEKGLPILKAVLQPAISWPAKGKIYNPLNCFKPQFEDCSPNSLQELSIESSKSLVCRMKRYSHFKGCGKINISTTPSGLVADVTREYCRKSSDKYIMLKEEVIENVSAGSAVMVDKGYDIDKETSSKGVKFCRPPILQKPQHTKAEAIYNTEVATSPIHVETVIQRLKIFDIFRDKLKRSMLQHIDDIVFVCCAIMNLNSPELADCKF